MVRLDHQQLATTPSPDTLRVLLVEDSKTDALISRKVLESRGGGYEVDWARSLEEARALLQSESHHDLILLDLHLGDSKGLDTLDEVRAIDGQTPIVLMTGLDDENVAREALRRGAQDYLIKTKPDPAALLRSVGYALERNRLVEELKAERNRIHSYLDALGSIVLVLDLDWRVVSINSYGLEVLGVDRQDLLMKEWVDTIVSPGDQAETRNSLTQVSQSGDTAQFHFECRVKTAAGGERLIAWRATRLCDAGADATNLILSGSDITDASDLQSQLLQAQKLEAIGRLAAGIAHEINTPTQYVGDNLMFMQTSFERLNGFVSTLCGWIEDTKRETVSRAELDEVAVHMKDANLNYLVGEVPEAAGQAIEGVGRISEIVLAMKEFSHPPSKERQPTNINQCIRSTATVARNEWKYIAEMTLDLAEDLPQIPCLPGEFNQTILNLIVNAAHAIDEVRKATAIHELGAIRIRTSHDETWVAIEIEDSGAGIPNEIAERIFDPFFTTKEVGKGTGQGLAIARSCIVDKLDGEMSFESKPGAGTTFTMKLPLAKAKRETEGAS